MRLKLDLGDDDHVEALEAHLAERGLGVDDILAAAAAIVLGASAIASTPTDEGAVGGRS